MRKLGFVLVAIAAALAAAPAAAETTYYAGDPSFSTSIPVTASVGGRCQFATGGAPSGSYAIPGFIDTDPWTHDFSFTIDCNTASRVGVVSTNGGLKTGATVSSPGYTGLAPYDVALTLDANGGTLVDASGSCSAASLKAGAAAACAFRGPASTLQGLALAGPSQNQTGSKLTVSAPAYAGTTAGATTSLVSGTDYSDTLTITIASQI